MTVDAHNLVKFCTSLDVVCHLWLGVPRDQFVIPIKRSLLLNKVVVYHSKNCLDWSGLTWFSIFIYIFLCFYNGFLSKKCKGGDFLAIRTI